MVYVFKTRNFNQIYQNIFDVVQSEGEIVVPRGKKTKEIRPVVIEITKPRERWTSSRSMNLPFCIAEVLWQISGRGDRKMVKHYMKRIDEFADDPYGDFNAPYGKRIRAYGEDSRSQYSVSRQEYKDLLQQPKVVVDQLECVYNKLKDDKDSRQCIITLWNPFLDNNRISNDFACNALCSIKIRDGKLDWTNFIRSNDLILGTPTNIMQFSHFMEIMAGWLDVEVGTLRLYIDSLHIYQNDYYDLEKVRPTTYDIYDIYKPQDARLPKDEFEVMLRDLSEAEEKWRHGNFIDDILCIENEYWRNFAQVLYAFNLLKYGSPKVASEVIETITNEYREPMRKVFTKMVKK